jgi:hypothetical protein
MFVCVCEVEYTFTEVGVIDEIPVTVTLRAAEQRVYHRANPTASRVFRACREPR